MTDARKNRLDKARELMNAPPTLRRRIIAAVGAGLLAAMLVTLFFVFVFGGANGVVFWLALVGSVIAAVSAAATLRVGVAVIYGLIGVAWVVMEVIAAVLAAIASAFS